MATLEILEKIICDVLKAFYQEFWASIIFAFLCMFLYKAFKADGIKSTIKKWFNDFCHSRKYRQIFYFFILLALILFRTVLCRPFMGWDNSLGNVFGNWSLHTPDGELTTEGIENVILFIPLLLFGLNAFKGKIFKGNKITVINTLSKSLVFSFLFSLAIECSQLLFKIGDFQLSDLFFNTVGGVIGGIVYYIIYKIVEHKEK